MRTTSAATAALIASLAANIAGCASPLAQGAAGPNYSTIPCSDNCGGDGQCMAHCTPAGNNPLPLGVVQSGH